MLAGSNELKFRDSRSAPCWLISGMNPSERGRTGSTACEPPQGPASASKLESALHETSVDGDAVHGFREEHARAAVSLHARLAALGYTKLRLTQLFDSSTPDGALGLGRDVAAARVEIRALPIEGQRAREGALSDAARLLFLGFSLRREVAERVLGAAVIRSLLELGVLYAVACADGATRLWSHLQLAPLQEHFANTTEAAHKLVLVFTDFLATSGKSRPGMEPVMFIGPDSRGLTSSLPTIFADAAPDRPRRLLDLCTGSGVQGIVAAARGLASDLTLVDVNPRSARLARFNLAMNGIADDNGRAAGCSTSGHEGGERGGEGSSEGGGEGEGEVEGECNAVIYSVAHAVDALGGTQAAALAAAGGAGRGTPRGRVLLGDLYSALEGSSAATAAKGGQAARLFDMITANPPYVPAAFSHAKYGDGGADGEQITARVFAGAAAHLVDGGLLAVVAPLFNLNLLRYKFRVWWAGHATMPSAGGNVLQGEQHAAVHVYHSQALSPAGLTALYDPSIQAGATDGGPWACTEDGCPSAELSCAALAALNACDSAFAEVWTTPPAGTEGRKVSELCPYACGVHRLREAGVPDGAKHGLVFIRKRASAVVGMGLSYRQQEISELWGAVDGCGVEPYPASNCTDVANHAVAQQMRAMIRDRLLADE